MNLRGVGQQQVILGMTWRVGLPVCCRAHILPPRPTWTASWQPIRSGDFIREYSQHSARLAQSVERETLNLKVAGSTPASGSIPDASQYTEISNEFFVLHSFLFF
ncbi:hypothetical protein F4823DRAFT_421185 [Ustulina deusta]|nr:hypothetical protein F4823DRAFT_421185 [Ustulina deusta]